MVRTRFPALFAAALFAACATAPGVPAPRAAACAGEPDPVGVWRSRRSSQLGPAWVNLEIACDCTYQTTIRTLFIRISERGTYRLEPGSIVFRRESGAETAMPYRLEGGRLVLREASDEDHAYARTRDARCVR